MSLMTLARRGRAIALIAGALLLVPIVAEAAPGGRSFGSRGSRSQSQVAPTPTAPGSSFQRNQAQTPGPSAATPGTYGWSAGTKGAAFSRPSVIAAALRPFSPRPREGKADASARCTSAVARPS